MNMLRSNPNTMTGLIIKDSLIFKSLSTDSLVFAIHDVADVSELYDSWILASLTSPPSVPTTNQSPALKL